MPLVVALLLLLCPLAVAQRPARKSAPQPAAPARQSWPIESISVEGIREYTEAQVLGVAGVRTGQTATAADFENMRKRLLDTGAFESVGYGYRPAAGGKGYALTIEVREATHFLPVRFEDLGIPDEKLRAALAHADPLFRAKLPATDVSLARYAALIQGILAAAGRQEKVTGRVVSDAPGEMAILFRPAKGPPAISRVRVTGNQVVPSIAIEQAINAVAVGVPFREARVRQLLDTSVRPLYDSRGRVRAAFPEVRSEPDKDLDGVVVTVQVAEGDSYSLGKVQVEGAGLAADAFDRLKVVKKGDVFSSEAIQQGITAIEQRLRREGYMQVKLSVDRRIDDKLKAVDLTIRVDEGPQYRFGRLNIDGLDIITEPAIRKMWGVKPGQPFNAEYPDRFLERIKEEGVFDNLGDTKALLKTDDQARTVDVTLIFKPAPRPEAKPKP